MDDNTQSMMISKRGKEALDLLFAEGLVPLRVRECYVKVQMYKNIQCTTEGTEKISSCIIYTHTPHSHELCAHLALTSLKNLRSGFIQCKLHKLYIISIFSLDNTDKEWELADQKRDNNA